MDIAIFAKNLKMKVLILDNNKTRIEKIKELFAKSGLTGHLFRDVSRFHEMKELHSNTMFDILFVNLDSETKEVFNFLEDEVSQSAQIIVTSSQNNMMIKAFKHNIAGYLTEPYDMHDFEQALKRIQKKNISTSIEEGKQDYSHFKKLIHDGEINRIALTTLDGFVIVHYDDIIRCEANGNYTSIYFHDGSFLMLTKTLKHYASRLEPHGFFRVHKTHLVNLNYIRSYIKGKNSFVELKDGSNIEVSSRKKQILVDILNN